MKYIKKRLTKKSAPETPRARESADIDAPHGPVAEPITPLPAANAALAASAAPAASAAKTDKRKRAKEMTMNEEEVAIAWSKLPRLDDQA